MTSKYFLQRFDAQGVYTHSIYATPEQETIIDFALSSSDSMMINALAGAAKTSTLEFLCKYLPIQPILSIAFNKRIVDELTKRLPGHVKCATLNSVGHRVWMKVSSKKLVVDTKKSYNILRGIVDGLKGRDKSAAYETFSETLRAIGKAKIAGYIPEGIFPHAKRLVTAEEFLGTYEDEIDQSLLDAALLDSINQSYSGLIDFDDQIYMPTLFSGTFPDFPVVMGDEVQDWSRINHEMLRKLSKGRLIVVGDPWQSIYGFRGAVSDGMASLKENFKLTEFPLSVSFRCPVEVVKVARSRVPHMQWAEGAKDGVVQTLASWSARDIPDGAAVICRNNAPLFSLAFKLIRAGRGISLVGFDIGPSLVKLLKKMGPLTLSQTEVYDAIDKWEAAENSKKRPKATVGDRAECLRVFASFGSDLGQAIAYAEGIFAQRGPIQLLSGHKAKGLEWEIVYHLDPWRIPSAYSETDEEKEQEHNVRYVIVTRTKNALINVDMRGLDA